MSGMTAADISVSLDGFVTGPNDGIGNGLGDGGERLHEWVFGLKSWREPHGLEGGETNADDVVMAEAVADAGAYVMGRRMFDIAEEPWGDEPPFHGPVFVVTHRPRDPLEKQGGTTFHFVTEGIEAAHDQARSAAGDKDVSVAGGASVIQQSLTAGLLDVIQIHLVPVFLGTGVRLFEGMDPDLKLALDRVVDSPAVTHLRYRRVR